MNKKDCERIGQILAETSATDAIVETFCKLDERIRAECEVYNAVNVRREAVSNRFDELMARRLGPSWMIRKAAREISKEVMTQAQKDIYGDDYHPSLFAGNPR